MQICDAGGYTVEIWKSPAEVEEMEYAEYWNNEEVEREKEFWTLDGDFARMEAYLERSSLGSQLQQCLEFVQQKLGRSLSGCGADLAAGSLWAVPRLLGTGHIDRVYAVEYSQHRLLKLGLTVLNHYQVPPERVILCLGSFYELHIADASLDFVFLSQAFHHAEDPGRLLAEIGRVLKPDGLVLMIGEHIRDEAPLSVRANIRRLTKRVLLKLMSDRVQMRVFGRQLRDDPPLPRLEPDPILGDHYYRGDEYDRMFTHSGFIHFNLRAPGSHFQSFVLVRRAGSGRSRSLLASSRQR